MSNYTKENLLNIAPSNVPAGTLLMKVGEEIFTAGSIEIGTDVSDTTATAEDVKQGKQFYDASGTLTQGTNDDIDVSATTAAASDVLTGKQFYNSEGILTQGTLVQSDGATAFYRCAEVKGDSSTSADTWSGYKAVLKEETIVTEGETVVVVSGAGTTEANGIYKLMDTSATGTDRIWKHESAEYYIWLHSASGFWRIASALPPNGLALYLCPTSGIANPWEVPEWLNTTGMTPVPTITQQTIEGASETKKYYTFEESLTTGLTYGNGFTPEVDGIYDAEALIKAELSIKESSESDIVSLLSLPRAISEYTDEHIGEIISIPYTDASGTISGPIEFEVVGVNHHKDVSDESKPTITLMSKNVLRYAAFDAKESSNPNSDSASYGNNRWSVSNIRQWLNSEGAAGSWYTAQHDYDAEPNSSNVSLADGAYSDEAGFLAGFNDDVKSHFATVSNITLIPSVDGSGTETTQDKVFLPSITEMNIGNLDDSYPEGTALSGKFTDESSRVKTGVNGYYWMRSHYPDDPYVFFVTDGGFDASDSAYDGFHGIAPLLVLC